MTEEQKIAQRLANIKYRQSEKGKLANKLYNQSLKGKNSQIKYRYKIEITEYDRIFAEQNGLCAICNKEMIKPHIDHDHNTGIVRGLLCNNCNLMLGHANDDITTLVSAIEYLSK